MNCLLMITSLMSFLTGRSAIAADPVVTNDDQHNEVYQRGSGRISPSMQLLGREPKVSQKVKEQILIGIKDLDAVTAYNPKNWAAFWIKGKGYQALGNYTAANAEFKASFGLQKENADVAREYAASCLELGLGDEAVSAARHAIALKPNDAGLHANLALALLISGKNAEAKNAILESLKMAPAGRISLAVSKIIDDVIAGKRGQPKTMGDLTKN